MLPTADRSTATGNMHKMVKFGSAVRFSSYVRGHIGIIVLPGAK